MFINMSVTNTMLARDNIKTISILKSSRILMSCPIVIPFLFPCFRQLSIKAREAKQELGTQTALLSEFEKLRQSVMGVNLDEEMANMVQYQHSYNAAAKMINLQNEMLDVIINRLGV
jgi:flagellar hook-associated protein 1 FlgK